MGNLIWTSVLYFSTIGIVYVTYRVFMEDRRADRLNLTQELIKRGTQQQRSLIPAEPVIRRP
jgi:hypothetical protein